MDALLTTLFYIYLGLVVTAPLLLLPPVRICRKLSTSSCKSGDALAREIFLMGWGRLRLEEWLLEPGIERAGKFGYSSHHIGTLRMADDPQFGVVDRHGRIFSCDNVYIGGSAVFPTSSFVNPTLTIVALACRMAAHLKQRLA